MEEKRFFSRRAVLTGVVLSFLVTLMEHYSINIVHGSYFAIDHMPAGGIFIFFVLVFLINPLLYSIRKALRFSAHELIMIYVMLLVTSSIISMGLGTQLCPMLAAPSYYATPENQWASLIQPHIKPWLVPQGEKVAQYFFEGLPQNETIPWLAWLKPLLFWAVFIFSLYLVMLCLMVILRQQWVEKEKLVFPLVQLPLEMVQGNDEGGRVTPFFKNKLMWIGFAIPVIFSTINALHHYFNVVPAVNLVNSVKIFQKSISLNFRISFPIIGFTYLVNQEVAFSVWFFSLVFTVLKGLFNITGVSSPENVGIYGNPDPIIAHLGTGAFFAMVMVGFWMARDHLRKVWAKAFGLPAKGRQADIDDSGEIMSYRTALCLGISGFIIMIVWLAAAGLNIAVAIFFLITAFVFWLGLTRVIAEAGIATMISPSIGSSQVVSAIGSANIAPQGMTALGLTYVYASDIRTFPMSSMAQGLKLSENLAKSRRGLFWAIILSVLLAFFVSNVLVLKLAYTYGGINLNNWYFNGGPCAPYNYVTSHLKHPKGPNISGWFCRGGGAMIMGLFMLMRYRFLWWPLHPLGFAIGGVNWIQALWFSICIVWVIKGVFLKYGGVRLYRQGRPFFLGLILGQYSIAGIWFFIDLITKHTGNTVFWI